MLHDKLQRNLSLIYTSDNEIYEDETAHALGVKHPDTVNYKDHLAMGAANDNEPPGPFPDEAMRQMQMDVSKIKELMGTLPKKDNVVPIKPLGANPVTSDKKTDPLSKVSDFDAIQNEIDKNEEYDFAALQSSETLPAYDWARKGVRMPKIDITNLPKSKNIVHSSSGEEDPVVPVSGQLSEDLGGEDMQRQFDRSALRTQFRQSIKDRNKIDIGETSLHMSPMLDRNNPHPGRVEGEGGGGFELDQFGNLSRTVGGGQKAELRGRQRPGTKPGTPSPLRGRDNWDPDLTKSLNELKDKGLTLAEIAKELGITRGQVAGKLFRQNLAK